MRRSSGGFELGSCEGPKGRWACYLFFCLEIFFFKRRFNFGLVLVLEIPVHGQVCALAFVPVTRKHRS